MGCCQNKPAPAAAAPPAQQTRSAKQPAPPLQRTTSCSETRVEAGESCAQHEAQTPARTDARRKSTGTAVAVYTDTAGSPAPNPPTFGSRRLPDHVTQRLRRQVMPASPWGPGGFAITLFLGPRIALPSISSTNTVFDVKIALAGRAPGVNIESMQLVVDGRLLHDNDVALEHAGVRSDHLVVLMFTGVRKRTLDFSARGWDSPDSSPRAPGGQRVAGSDDPDATSRQPHDSHNDSRRPSLFEPSPIGTKPARRPSPLASPMGSAFSI